MFSLPPPRPHPTHVFRLKDKRVCVVEFLVVCGFCSFVVVVVVCVGGGGGGPLSCIVTLQMSAPVLTVILLDQ